MTYIVDGNNLSGKLGILKYQDFNQMLISSLLDYFSNTNKKVVLVFDSNDPLGDKYIESNLTVIYSPRDNYYTCADDKIMELIDHNRRQNVVVSDDIEIIKKVKTLNDKGYSNISYKKATALAFDIQEHKNRQGKGEIDKNKGLSNDEVTEINKEMLDEFIKKKKKEDN